MVWYGDDYAQELGVSLENFRAKPSTSKEGKMSKQLQPLDQKPQLSSLQLPQSSLQLPQSSLQLPQSSLQLPQSSLQLPQSSLQLPQSSLQLPQSSPSLHQPHRLVHDRVKPHMCPDCGKTFTRPDTLKTHRLLHTGEKPHMCPDCGKRFNQLGSMKTHRLLHTGEKPHVCPDCGKRFNRLSSMKTHRLIHTDVTTPKHSGPITTTHRRHHTETLRAFNDNTRTSPLRNTQDLMTTHGHHITSLPPTTDYNTATNLTTTLLLPVKTTHRRHITSLPPATDYNTAANLTTTPLLPIQQHRDITSLHSHPPTTDYNTATNLTTTPLLPIQQQPATNTFPSPHHTAHTFLWVEDLESGDNFLIRRLWFEGECCSTSEKR
ncbi:hypothetical protein Pcinc_012643 [Petrolisthes cinctipes]|uniref:C2H2-type domain-containing protein n=1 Tax=Petrolisthes cinctipes TaxID=88211 RepID=A0AAE1KSD2_PETCI|nr:hypothetical protein Pcinc_012643 [Petrolisthes cinctipes]